MTDDTRRHITVTPDDEEDFVIRAGVSSIPTEPSAEAGVRAVNRSGIQPTPPEDSLPASQETTDPSVLRNASPSSDPASEQAFGRDGYKETTLEDIESAGGMSKMQGVIIALAVLAVLGFILYYNVAMR